MSDSERLSEPPSERVDALGGEAPPPGQARRVFFRTCLGGMGVLTGGFVLAPVATFLQPPQTLSAQGPVKVPLEELETGQAIYREVRGTPVVIIPGAEGPVVFNASCTHLGCLVRWERDTRTFICPCHGALFDAKGTPLKGPTNQPLAPLSFEVQEGNIVIG